LKTTVRQNLQAAYRFLRKKGVREFREKAFRVGKLRWSIFVRRHKTIVDLDGCQFPVRELPNTQMKLELLTGTYERPERNAVRRYLRPEWPVVELGGCFGVVACITNKRLRDPRAHVVIEASPLVIPFLCSNRDRNHCSFKIVNRALAYAMDTVTFSPEIDFWGNALRPTGRQPTVTVPATQLRQVLEEEGFDRFALICDIEGHEYELVTQEPDALARAELIILEVHPHFIGEDKVQRLLSRLAALGFKIIDQCAQVLVLKKPYSDQSNLEEVLSQQ
jgi:FkbM family methyltransferase